MNVSLTEIGVTCTFTYPKRDTYEERKVNHVDSAGITLNERS